MELQEIEEKKIIRTLKERNINRLSENSSLEEELSLFKREIKDINISNHTVYFFINLVSKYPFNHSVQE